MCWEKKTCLSSGAAEGIDCKAETAAGSHITTRQTVRMKLTKRKGYLREEEKKTFLMTNFKVNSRFFSCGTYFGGRFLSFAIKALIYHLNKTLHKDPFVNVQRSFTHESPKLKTTQMSTNRCMYKQNVEYSL